MATIEELTDENNGLKTQVAGLQQENTVLRAQLADLQEENVRLLGVEEAVRGIVHQIEVHDATPEDLRDALVTLKTKALLSG